MKNRMQKYVASRPLRMGLKTVDPGTPIPLDTPNIRALIGSRCVVTAEEWEMSKPQEKPKESRRKEVVIRQSNQGAVQ